MLSIPVCKSAFFNKAVQRFLQIIILQPATPVWYHLLVGVSHADKISHFTGSEDTVRKKKKNSTNNKYPDTQKINRTFVWVDINNWQCHRAACCAEERWSGYM